MNRRLAAAALAALPLAALPLAAAAQDANHWSYIGGWDVDYYPALGGCAAATAFDQGINFLIGIDTAGGDAQLAIAVMHRDWTGISPGATYDITVQFDSRTPWDVSAAGLSLDGLHGFLITEPVESSAAAAFVDEFQRGYTMTWRTRGNSLGRLSLKDSRRAMDAAIACTRAYLR